MIIRVTVKDYSEASLEAAIQELKEGFSKEKAKADKFKELEAICNVSLYSDFIVLTASEKGTPFKGLSKVLDLYPPTRNEYTIEHTKRISLKTPYAVRISNDWTGPDFGVLEVSYVHEGYTIRIRWDVRDLPTVFEQYFSRYSGEIGDTEHVYFTGMSVNEIRGVRKRSSRFNLPEVTWYKRQHQLCTEAGIEAVVESLCTHSW